MVKKKFFCEEIQQLFWSQRQRKHSFNGIIFTYDNFISRSPENIFQYSLAEIKINFENI